MSLIVRQAHIGDLDDLAPLFDDYRQFYGQTSDPVGARRFLFERFEHCESVVFIARTDDGAAVGFTQLYPAFSSTRMSRTYVLNDLFVTPQGRGRGAGRALLEAAAAFGRAMGAVELSLMTARTNLVAQGLYRSAGWVLDETYLTFELTL